jgi:hypothetical protein
MKLIRLKAGANDFCLANLTLGQIMAIRTCMEHVRKVFAFKRALIVEEEQLPLLLEDKEHLVAKVAQHRSAGTPIPLELYKEALTQVFLTPVASDVLDELDRLNLNIDVFGSDLVGKPRPKG